MTVFNQRTLQVLERTLEGAVCQQKAIAHNLANVNTPGFKSLKVSFKNQLKENLNAYSDKLVLKVTSDKHISNYNPGEFEPHITRDTQVNMRPDGNNVDIDREMTMMSKNSIYYSTAISLLNKRLSILKYVISEGRR